MPESHRPSQAVSGTAAQWVTRWVARWAARWVARWAARTHWTLSARSAKIQPSGAKPRKKMYADPPIISESLTSYLPSDPIWPEDVNQAPVDRAYHRVAGARQSQHSHSTVTAQSQRVTRACHRIAATSQSQHSHSTAQHSTAQHSHSTATAQSQRVNRA